MSKQFRPSASKRWLACTASPSQVDPNATEPENEAQREGTFGHLAGEFILTDPRQLVARDLLEDPKFASFVEDKLGFSYNIADYLQDDLIDAIDAYVEYVRRIPGKLSVEVGVSLDHLIPGMGGTSDACVLEERDGKRILHNVDAKFGRGTRVLAADNTQLGLYAIGMLSVVGEVNEVWLHIVQPRLHHYDQWATTPEWLDDLSTRVKAAYDAHVMGCGTFQPGEEQCKWCPAAATCGAYAIWVRQTTALDFDSVEWPLKDAIALQPDELAIKVLPNLDAIQAWVDKVRAHATAQAVAGVELPGWKLVESTTRRRWKNEDAAAQFLLSEFDDSKVFTKKLVSISAAEKLLGKAGKDQLAQFTDKPKGSAVLARSDDKRPAINPKDAALAEFDNFIE